MTQRLLEKDAVGLAEEPWTPAVDAVLFDEALLNQLFSELVDLDKDDVFIDNADRFERAAKDAVDDGDDDEVTRALSSPCPRPASSSFPRRLGAASSHLCLGSASILQGSGTGGRRCASFQQSGAGSLGCATRTRLFLPRPLQFVRQPSRLPPSPRAAGDPQTRRCSPFGQGCCCIEAFAYQD